MRVCVFVCPLCLYPATPGWGVRCGCGCLGSGFGCARPLLDGVLGCVCVCVLAPLVPRHSWLGWAVWVCVLGLGFRLRPATPGWGVGLFACLCARSACTPPLLAGECGVRVCVWARVSAAPRHSWLGCWGVRVCVRAPLVPRHSWVGCAVWVCVLGLGFWLRPATPGWSVKVCVFVCTLRLYAATPGWDVGCGCVRFGSGFSCAPPLLAGVLGHARRCACSPCTPPLLAGVCGVGVCAWARVSAAPRQSWLGCWGVLVCVRAPLLPRHSWLGCAVWVCVFGLQFRLRPASPGWGVWVCVFVCTPRLDPATPGWGLRSGCGCLGSGFGCVPPFVNLRYIA